MVKNEIPYPSSLLSKILFLYNKMACKNPREINCQFCNVKLAREIACGTCGLVLCRMCTHDNDHHCQPQEIKIKSGEPDIISKDIIDHICANALSLVESSRTLLIHAQKVELLTNGLAVCNVPEARTILSDELNLITAKN